MFVDEKLMPAKGLAFGLLVLSIGVVEIEDKFDGRMVERVAFTTLRVERVIFDESCLNWSVFIPLGINNFD